MRTLLAGLLILATSGCASTGEVRPAAATDGLLAGVARIDITPQEPIRLTGYGNRSVPTADIRQRLHAKALALSDARGRPAVLITADLVGIPRHVSDEVARRLEPAGISREQLVVSATHTHTGPMLSRTLPFIFGAPVPPEEQAASERYTHRLIERLERVARDALADLRPSRLSWSQGRAGFAANRRVLENGKWVAFGVNREGPVDHDLPLLAVHALDGRLRAVLVNYACHATTLEGKDNFVHGDWPGSAQALVEARHPETIAMMAIGAGADANPYPRGGGIRDVERHAREVADEADRLLSGPMRTVSAAAHGRLQWVELRFSGVPSREEWQRRAAADGAVGLHARAMLSRQERGDDVPGSAPYAVQVWTFSGDLAMVFLAGEVVADYSLRLKRELDGSRLWVNAYSNDVSFYVASQRMIPEGGYEVDRSMVYYGQPAPLAPETEEEIIRTVRGLVPRAFARRR